MEPQPGYTAYPKCGVRGCDNQQRWFFDSACCHSHRHALFQWAFEVHEALNKGESPPDRPHVDELETLNARSKRWTPERMQEQIDEFRGLV